MINRKLDHIIEQHYAYSKNALYLYGARQVGKSYAIRKYAQAHYPIYLELNFYKDKALRDLVATAQSPNLYAYVPSLQAAPSTSSVSFGITSIYEVGNGINLNYS